MAKQFSNENHRLLYSRARDIVFDRYRIDNRLWLHSDSGLFKAMRVFFCIFTAVNLLIYLAYLLGRALYYYDFAITAESHGTSVTELRNSIILTVVCIGALIASVILLRLRSHIAAGICAAAGGLPMLPHFFLAMANNTSRWPFVIRHALPILLMAACGIYLAAVTAAEKRAISRQYNKIINAIYESHRDRDRLTTDEEWNRSITEYIEKPYSGKLKRSKKNRLRKEAAKMPDAGIPCDKSDEYGADEADNRYTDNHGDDENDNQ